MAERKKGQGSEKRQREAVVQYRTSKESAAALRAAAEGKGMSLGAYLREREEGTAGPRSVKIWPDVPHEDLLVSLRAELGHQGGNFNQLAYLQQIGDMEKPARFDEAHDKLTTLYDLITHILKTGYAPP